MLNVRTTETQVLRVVALLGGEGKGRLECVYPCVCVCARACARVGRKGRSRCANQRYHSYVTMVCYGTWAE